MTTKPNERLSLTGKTALITGGASGIGLETAKVFAQAGAQVVIGDRNEGTLQEAQSQLKDQGISLEIMFLDVTREDSVIEVMRKMVTLGSYEVLVNSAGTGARMEATELPLELWQEVLNINLTGTFLCSREAAKMMLEQGKGSIVNVASIMGLIGGGVYPNPAYQASKGGVVNLTRSLALDWASRGIRVNAVAPAFVRTPLTQSLLAENGMEEKLLVRTPLGRIVETYEVADAIRFLASDAAAMITGHTLPVDGGWVAQ
ncbi:MAG: NAD-dependent dehydratase [Deltaproteobacteria bacterium]|nr:NAD-dependent dehydratase [Deltaproteobacteria bacterium]